MPIPETRKSVGEINAVTCASPYSSEIKFNFAYTEEKERRDSPTCALHVGCTPVMQCANRDLFVGGVLIFLRSWFGLR